jgi:hypothetical protein
VELGEVEGVAKVEEKETAAAVVVVVVEGEEVAGGDSGRELGAQLVQVDGESVQVGVFDLGGGRGGWGGR